MMNFYYDESEHSRKINKKTVTQRNYYDNFVTAIVGWEESFEEEVKKSYEIFESKFHKRKSNGELKSTTIKPKQLKNGFASLTYDNLNFVEDFFEIFDERIYLYFSVTSKIEFLVNQLFQGYENSLSQDADALRYTIVKSIVMYQPEKIIHGIYYDTLELANLIKDFYKQRIELNQQNPELKRCENEAFKQVIILLNDIDSKFKIDWNYHISFYGFRQYLEGNGITDFSLFLDKEGEESKTLVAAKEIGLNSVTELDSKDSVGIRVADMLVGLLGKLLKSLHDALKYHDSDDALNKKLLKKEWFVVNERQLTLYKKMCYIISQLNNSWYKSFSGIYADDFLMLMTLVNYFSNFDSIEKLNAYTAEEHQERLNSAMVTILTDYLQEMHSKLPITSITPTNKDYYYNQKGAMVYFDDKKQPLLNLEEGSYNFFVLSVGFTKNMSALITIKIEDSAICYRLPDQLLSWAIDCVAMANRGEKLFPAEVVFLRREKEYSVDFL